jgi:hypothetical protein
MKAGEILYPKESPGGIEKDTYREQLIGVV